MSSYEQATDRGFLLSTREWTAVGGATGLMALNIALMAAFVGTPLAVVNDYLFASPIIGMLVYGAFLTGGQYVAERGVKNGNLLLAVTGVAVLELAFGTFGAGVLSILPETLIWTALGITAVITLAMTILVGTYIYARRGTTFEHYSTWSTYAFVGGLGAGLVGTFVPIVLLAAFVLIFVGFVFRLGWEIWQIRDNHATPASLQAIGLYVAVAGVFVHILQIVVRMLAEE